MKTMRLGTLYLDPEHFVDEANKTVGKALTDASIFVNRRSVTARVNEDGEKIKAKVIKFFEDKGIRVKLRWDKNAGCRMCPCSPGFNVIAVFPYDLETIHYPLTDNQRIRFDVDNGKLKIRKPLNENGFKAVVRAVKEIPNSFNYIMEG